MYFESHEKDRPEIQKRAESIGFHMNWDHYTALTSYFPSIIYTELPPDSEYDLLTISPHDSLMTGRFTTDNPYQNELATNNPFTYSIAMNAETARKKGIQDGDTICLENRYGDKETGRVKLTQLIHPQVVAAVGLGGWAKGRTVGRSKGINYNGLLRMDQYHMCPVSGSAEPTARVKAYKV
jgi:anaerobic selenocysteine-containing dehydrogenase